MTQTVFIACDHGGVGLKSFLQAAHPDLDWQDLGTHSEDSVDYPDYAEKLVVAMKNTPDALGVLICGTGIGISIAANRHKHIRAALCCTTEMAQLSREHNNANVLALGARITDNNDALNILNTFLNSNFEGGRHTRRVAKMS